MAHVFTQSVDEVRVLGEQARGSVTRDCIQISRGPRIPLEGRKEVRKTTQLEQLDIGMVGEDDI